MATETLVVPPALDATIPRRKFTVEEFQRLAEVGILHEDDRVELIDGELIVMPPIGGDHADGVDALTYLVGRAIDDSRMLRVQNPLDLGLYGTPQPDLAIVKRQRYGPGHPSPTDVSLVVEVAESSRDYDRTIKFPRYATAGIPEAWLVDLVAGIIERHSAPHNGRYSLIATAGRGQSLTSTVLPALILDVDAILGPVEE